jgi:hypothetical protein
LTYYDTHTKRADPELQVIVTDENKHIEFTSALNPEPCGTVRVLPPDVGVVIVQSPPSAKTVNETILVRVLTSPDPMFNKFRF